MPVNCSFTMEINFYTEFLQTLGLPLTSSVILSTGSTKFHPTSNPSPRKISSSSATNVEQSLQSQTGNL